MLWTQNNELTTLILCIFFIFTGRIGISQRCEAKFHKFKLIPVIWCLQLKKMIGYKIKDMTVQVSILVQYKMTWDSALKKLKA